MNPIRSHYCSWALDQGMLPNVYKDSSEIVTTVDTGLRWLVAPEQVLIEICGCGDFSVHSTDGN